MNNGGVLIVASTLNPDDAIAAYQQRWCIEVLFGNLKNRGFDLEQTRMTQLYKMDKLMALLAVASTWCLLVGHAEHGEANELTLLRHYRPEKSLFRLGLDALRQVLKNFFSPLQQRVWRVFLKLLSST